MALSGEEIRKALQVFAAKWSVYDGSERAEAQTFCNELFACFGQDRQAVATFEQPQAGRFLDLIWPRVCIIEMKAPKEAKRLDKHRQQALDYWREAADPQRNVPAPQFVVLCAFRKLEIWEPGAYPNAPRLELDLVELPDQYDALLFLAGKAPVFTGGQVALTRDAVSLLTLLFAELRERRAAGSDVLREFLLQSVWCLFAEDLGLLPSHAFTRLLDDLIANPSRSSADDLGGLFRWLNDPAAQRPSQGAYEGIPYANGGLFADPAAVHLEPHELELLRQAAGYDWTEVQPQIFGSLLEGGLGHDKQWALAAHYTAEADIQKVIQPTIVRPWTERIENLRTHAEAKAAQADLQSYVVLDPACGSGNFLYVAYRELRRLEARLRAREAELQRKAASAGQETLAAFFPVSNLRGIDIDGFAVGLARMVIWIGHKLAVDELDIREATLPLADLSGIRVADALRAPWPRASVIIGNPPFHGAQQVRSVLGDAYTEWLKGEFGVGVKDYCVYWFRKAHHELGTDGRAGLVGTNSISQNRGRSASLDPIVADGGVITDAVSKQEWPGEAVVNVSIVNWIKSPKEPIESFTLDGEEVGGITSSLEDTSTALARPTRLTANKGRAFQGPIPVGDGFILEPEEAMNLLQRPDADYSQVVRPYLVGRDIANDPQQLPTRYAIDFGSLPLEAAMKFPGALAIVRERVKPERDKNKDPGFRENWWRFGRPRGEMRRAIAGLPRFIAGTATGKRVLFCWVDPVVCPSNATNVFAFADDYFIGVLSSAIHTTWAHREGSTMRVDPRYTPTSAFETFPFPPSPSKSARDAVAAAARDLLARRTEICIAGGIGLTTLYNGVAEGAWKDVRDLHASLEQAVAASYGWEKGMADDPSQVRRLLTDLNVAISNGDLNYSPF